MKHLIECVNNASGGLPNFFQTITYFGFSKNEKVINFAIENYCKIWPKSSEQKKLFPIHGDFSMSNIIFNKNNFTVIDWEHFKHNSAPLGFDALNLIFEQTLIEYQINKTINNIAEKIKLLIELLVKNKSIDELFFHKPLNKIIDFVRNNRHIWGGQCEKLPILKFNKELVELVDKEISYDK